MYIKLIKTPQKIVIPKLEIAVQLMKDNITAVIATGTKINSAFIAALLKLLEESTTDCDSWCFNKCNKYSVNI